MESLVAARDSTHEPWIRRTNWWAPQRLRRGRSGWKMPGNRPLLVTGLFRHSDPCPLTMPACPRGSLWVIVGPKPLPNISMPCLRPKSPDLPNHPPDVCGTRRCVEKTQDHQPKLQGAANSQGQPPKDQLFFPGSDYYKVPPSPV